MDEDTDEELEERNEEMEPHVQLSSSSEDDTEDMELTFRATRAVDSSYVFDFTGPPNDVNRLAASDINAESSPFSILTLFFRPAF